MVYLGNDDGVFSCQRGAKAVVLIHLTDKTLCYIIRVS